jgi:hypothetical protein
VRAVVIIFWVLGAALIAVALNFISCALAIGWVGLFCMGLGMGLAIYND